MSESTAIRENKKESARQAVPAAGRAGRFPAAPSPADSVFFLQRTIGNQAVQRLFKAGLLQAKLKIGSPNDVCEQEADRMADQVMSMPDTAVGDQRSALSRGSESLQRKPGCPFARCSQEGEEEALRARPIAERITPLVQRQTEVRTPEEEEEEPETVQTKRADNSIAQRQEEEEEPVQAKLLQRQEKKEELQAQPEEEEAVQPKTDSNKTDSVSSAVESGIRSLRGGGQPLSGSSRAFFEPRFDADFSGVRVHTDANANHLARSIHAKAFTLGRDVVFGAGQYEPASNEGRRLLAHELTHVVQQNGGGMGKTKPSAPPVSASIQRWEASEHVHIAEQVYTGETLSKHFARIVGKKGPTKVKLANAEISYAEAAAMADLFEDYDQMYNAPKHEIDRHLRTIKSEQSVLIEERKGTSVKQPFSERSQKILKEIDMQFTEATAVRYLDLAKKNYAHFTHVHIAGANNNIQEWQKQHEDAADVARHARKKRNADELSKAFAKNSFADHYLMDAFAVGHLTGRSAEEDGMRAYLESKLDDIISGVLIEKIGMKWYSFFLLITPGVTHLFVFLATLAGLKLASRDDIKSLPFKIVHDMDNRYGRKVSNKEGDEWEAYGDKFLVSKENKKSNYPRVVNAVKKSKDEIVSSALSNKQPKNEPASLYPSDFQKRNWNKTMAEKALKDLFSEKFSMLEILWTADNIVRRYIKKTTPEEMSKISTDGKIRMICKLLPGWTGNEDERAVLKILKHTQAAHVRDIMKEIGFHTVADAIHGKEYEQFVSDLAEKYSTLPVGHKIIFINNLLKGATLDTDEKGILEILRRSSAGDAYRIVTDIRFQKFADKIHGAEYDKFLDILIEKYQDVNVHAKKELINALLQGTTGDREESAITKILQSTEPRDVATIIDTIGFQHFDDNIHGGEYRTFLNVLVNKYKHAGVEQKIRLVKSLCNGRTSGEDERAILKILGDSQAAHVWDIMKEIGFHTVADAIHGKEYEQFVSDLAEKYSTLPVGHKIIFINNLLKGATLDADEKGILEILRRSSAGDVYRIVNDIRFQKFADKIHGAEYDKFLYILIGKYQDVNVHAKKELINALLQGTTGDREESAITKILRVTEPRDVATIIDTIGFEHFDDNIHGGEYRTFLNVLVDKYQHADVEQKISLVRSLCNGRTSEVEEETIVALLSDSNDSSVDNFKRIVQAIGKSRLYSELTGTEENQFEEMLDNAGMR